MQALLSPRARVVAAAVIAVGAAVVAWLAALGWHTGSNSADTATTRWILAHTGANAQHALLALSLPALSVVVPVVFVGVALLARAWNVAVLAALAPLITVLISEVVLKPLVHRVFLPELFSGYAARGVQGIAFPSGHESGVVGWAGVALLLLPRLPWPRSARVVAAAGLVVYLLAAAYGLVANLYHYPTDTIGAIGVGAVVVPAVALIIDAVVARHRVRARAQGRSEPAQLT